MFSQSSSIMGLSPSYFNMMTLGPAICSPLHLAAFQHHNHILCQKQIHYTILISSVPGTAYCYPISAEMFTL